MEEGEDFLYVGKREASEETSLPFFSYRFIKKKEAEVEGKRKELERTRRKYEQLKGKGEERRNAFTIVERLKEQGKVIPPQEDWVTSTIHSYIGLLSKTIARDVVKECAQSLARGEKVLPFLERGIEIYQKRRMKAVEEAYEERFRGKLKAHISQLLESVEEEMPAKDAEAYILYLADEFQSWENLRVDSEILRAAFQKSQEFPNEPVLIITEDADLIDLFLLTRELRSRLFQNVKYCDLTGINEIYHHLKKIKLRLANLD